MNFLALLKTMLPILEPIGEQGLVQLFVTIDAEIAAMPKSDLRDAATIFSPAIKQFAILEMQKLKGG